MHPEVDSNGTDTSPRGTPAFIASLIESAATSFEINPAASREYLFRAYALIRAQSKSAGDLGSAPVRGRLATWQTKRILAYISDNLSAEIHTKELARLANLSVSHFFRAFKVSIGVPPKEFITRARIERACERMRTSDAPLSQVALDSGLNDQSSFCRVFRRLVGQSPSEWRRTNAAGPRTASQSVGTAHSIFISGKRAHHDSHVWPIGVNRMETD